MVPALAPALAQSATEREVLQSIQQIVRDQGRINFSELYNNPRFNPDQKQFLGRLYEIFFAVPGYLKAEFQSTGEIPSREEIAGSFGISTASVNLLLAVMEADRRVPPLYERDPNTGELTSLKLDAINAFLARRGDQIKLTGWEGQQVPAFEITTYEGETLTHHELKGKRTLLYFWFTGCPPCVRIAPILAELQEEYGAQGFQVIGLNADEVLEIGTTHQERLDAARKKGNPYVNANLNPETRKAFGSVNVFPTLFFVDSTGKIRSHLVNFQDKRTLEEVIAGLVQ